jgi:hypothetical protein
MRLGIFSAVHEAIASLCCALLVNCAQLVRASGLISWTILAASGMERQLVVTLNPSFNADVPQAARRLAAR